MIVTTFTCGRNFAAATLSTLTTDSVCSAALTLPSLTFTTIGAGCLTKTVCSGYNYATICNTASTTTDGKKCIWSRSVCINIICLGNTKAQSDSECDTYLKGCRTTGTGCYSSFNFTALSYSALCLKDS